MSKEKNGKRENSHNYAKDWCALKIAKNFKNCETWEKLVDETQMPQSQKCTDTFIITYKVFLIGLQGLYFISNPDGRPCMGEPTLSRS